MCIIKSLGAELLQCLEVSYLNMDIYCPPEMSVLTLYNPLPPGEAVHPQHGHLLPPRDVCAARLLRCPGKVWGPGPPQRHQQPSPCHGRAAPPTGYKVGGESCSPNGL